MAEKKKILYIDNFDLICLHYVVDYAILEKNLGGYSLCPEQKVARISQRW